VRRLLTIATPLLLLVALPLIAKPQNQKAIVGATLIDGTGGSPRKEAVIVIEGTRISQVGTRNTIRLQKNTTVIDATGKFIIPGLADMHNHLGEGNFDLNQGPADYQTNLRRLLGWGFTSVFNFGMPSIEDFAQLKRVSAAEDSAFPHFFGSGQLLRAKEGHGSLQGGFTPETPAEARRQVRELKKAKVDAVKFVHTDLRYVTTQSRPLLKPEVIKAIVDEAHKLGLRAFVHAPVLEYAKEALRVGADGLVHAVISDRVDDEFLLLMKSNNAAYITTHAIFEAAGDIGKWSRRMVEFDELGLIPKQVHQSGLSPTTVERWEEKWNNTVYTRDRLKVMRENLKDVWEAGILVVAGSDTGNSGAGTLLGLASQLELLLLLEAGLSPELVLQAATINAARMLGREKDFGTIEAGKLADLLILDANPLIDIRNIRRINRVIKGGLSYKQSELLTFNQKRRS